MSVIEWSEVPQLGNAATNANHVEFCALLSAVADVSDAEFTGALDIFIDHIERHFTEENAWMDATDSPPRHCHRGERDNVLVPCREVRRRVVTDEMELSRRLVAESPARFTQHVDVMNHMMTTYLA